MLFLLSFFYCSQAEGVFHIYILFLCYSYVILAFLFLLQSGGRDFSYIYILYTSLLYWLNVRFLFKYSFFYKMRWRHLSTFLLYLYYLHMALCHSLCFLLPLEIIAQFYYININTVIVSFYCSFVGFCTFYEISVI